MIQKDNPDLKKIAKHVGILNEELGKLDKSFLILQTDQKVLKIDVALMKKDISWIKRIGYFISTTILIAAGKIIFFS